MFQKLSLKDLPINGKKVLMRVDFNVPLDKSQNILDASRIEAALPSIRYVIEHGAALILMSHLGRPKGKASKEFSLAPIAQELSQLLGKPVKMAPDCIGKDVQKMAEALQTGEILLLENLRFHSAEENPSQDPSFAKQLADLADFYVNDAFGADHRAHSSTAEIAKYFPDKAAAGFLLEKEIQFLSKVLEDPQRPFFAIIGGKKISTKIATLKALLKKVDKLLIGGGMAYTFFKAQGFKVGRSICEDDQLNKAREILNLAKEKNIPLLLPKDVIAVKEPSKNAQLKSVKIADGIPDDLEGVDIGPETIEEFKKAIQHAKMIFWNGPLGIFEIKPFDRGTFAIAQAVANSNALTIAGGGETVSALQESGLAEKISHLSTGGGATLEYIEQGTLPGLEALSPARTQHVK